MMRLSLKGDISVFGSTGFIGSRFCKLNSDKCIREKRENRLPASDDILYLISTTTNYNVFNDVHIDIDTNLSILVDVLQHCKDRAVTFNFISSWFVYGDTALPASESSVCNPKGFYSITKRAAEQLIISYCETFNIKYRILRLCNVIGTNDNFSKQKNALQFIIDKIKNNEKLNLYHNGDFIRDYMHIDDVCAAIKHCLVFGDCNEVYNIGSGTSTKFIDIINYAVDKFDSSSIIESIKPPPFHDIVQVKDMWLDTKKLDGLGFKPQMTVYDSIDAIYD